jgi:hypothetical protein
MSPLRDRVVLLQQALLHAPEYYSLPDEVRAACKRFLSLLGSGNPEDPHAIVRLEAAYGSALTEARSLIARMRLTLDAEHPLPSEEAVLVSASNVDPNPYDQGSAECRPEEPTPVPDYAGDSSTEVDQSSPLPSVITHYEFHPVADLFPLMADDELRALADDIRANGQREPAWLWQGKIIDGRNRYRACVLEGRETWVREWDGQGSLVAFVLSLNLHRRHLTDQQRALVAARANEAFEAEALERRNANLQQNKGSTDGLDPGHRSRGRSAELAAKALGVSRDSVNKAAKILKEGDEALIQAVQAGEASLDAAATVARLPREEQREAVKKNEVKETARRARSQARPTATPTTVPGEVGTDVGDTDPDPVSVVQDPASKDKGSRSTVLDSLGSRLRSELESWAKEDLQGASEWFDDFCGATRARLADLAPGEGDEQDTSDEDSQSEEPNDEWADILAGV